VVLGAMSQNGLAVLTEVDTIPKSSLIDVDLELSNTLRPIPDT
jgi:hypothetical protein